MERYSQLKRFGLYDAKVPRYNSYPTVTNFSNSFRQDLHVEWIEDLASSSKVSLYIHIPYCRHLCWFCACRTQVAHGTESVESYLLSLLSEIKKVGALLPKGVRVAEIAWGGGTPTLLNPSQIAILIRALHDAFEIEPSAEFRVEVDPNEIDDSRIQALAASGVTRAAIGIQDFDGEIQAIIGRSAGYHKTRWTVEALNAHGIEALDLELLYGLPMQTTERIADTAQMLLSLGPDRVAVNGYLHAPAHAKRQSLIPTKHLPEPEMRLDLFDTARNLLSWDGYQHIGLDHFVRPSDSLARAARQGELRRCIDGYTTTNTDVLIGLGASAVSKFPGGYVQNSSGTASYQTLIEQGLLATERGHAFRGDDLLIGRMIEMLLCVQQISMEQIVVEGIGTEEQILPIIKDLSAQFPGAVCVKNDVAELATHARPLAPIVARHIDRYSESESSPA